MAKRVCKIKIVAHVSGSFTGQSGRIRYNIKPGVVRESDVDPEVLAVLIATGAAVRVRSSTRAAGSAGSEGKS